MSAQPTQKELNESIEALKNYRSRLRKELLGISQKLRMPQSKIDKTLKEHSELKEVELALAKLIEQSKQSVL